MFTFDGKTFTSFTTSNRLGAPVKRSLITKSNTALWSVITVLQINTAAVADSYSIISEDPHLNIIPRTEAEVARISAITTSPTDFTSSQRFEELSAGAATVRVLPNTSAFSQPSNNIPFEGELEFKMGNGLFRKLWVSSPSSTLASDGLGPLYNARSCQRCHVKDGRGHPPSGPNDNRISMFLRVGIPTVLANDIAQIEAYLASIPDPNYGRQVQDFALAGHPVEAQLDIEYTEFDVPLSGGETVSLRRPEYHMTNLGYGPLHPKSELSPRVAPQMIGLGLLEAIPAADILALADPDDENGDGISGRPNIVWSREFDRPMLGRFGLKANQPTILQQSAAAFAGDIGISNPLFSNAYGDCTIAQSNCIDTPHGDGDERVYEVDGPSLDLVTFYSRNLAVPKRRNVSDPNVLRGKEVFYSVGCTSCHQPSYVTHRLQDQPEQSFQLIWPYTDLLLHDMGPNLADGLPEGQAMGSEWRTPPLWGIGMTKQVSGHTYFLHDGRARSLLEAILWHGGEAEVQRDAVINIPKDDRAALIEFLESL